LTALVVTRTPIYHPWTLVETNQDTRLKRHETREAVRRWVESFVIDLNLCPFAKREMVARRVRFIVVDAATEATLLDALAVELDLLSQTPEIETTLVIHPEVLGEFDDYNQFLDIADRLLVDMGLEGVFQIASFHPDYQFAGTEPDDAENYTNRSPFPILHLLREASLEKAIAATPDIEQVPERNIATMNSLGVETLGAMLRSCIEGTGRKNTGNK
jgi:hypothetical protein